MKATNHSGEQAGSKKSMYRPAGSSQVETAVYVALVLAGLVTIAIAFLAGSMPAGPRSDPASQFVNYVRRGQVMADLRTATAMAHYLLEKESLLATNAIETEPANKNSSTRTNTVAGAPKVPHRHQRA